MEFKKAQLDNGLDIIAEINPAAQSAACGFFVRTGSRDESPDVSGVSHFLEHMLFKGADDSSAIEVNKAFDNLGAKYNAFTSEETTVYYSAVLPEYLPDVLGIWTKLLRPALRNDDFDIEKNVILEEIAMYRDMPAFEVLDEGRSLHFGPHPCGNSVLGSEQSVKSLAAEQMRAYFNNRYCPNNIVLACCGNLDFDRLCRQINSACKDWQRQPAPRPLSHCQGAFGKQEHTKKGLVRRHICLLSPAVSMQDPRRFAMSLLSSVIGDDTGSRYFWAMVDPAVAEVASMQFQAMDGTGVLYSYFCCEPANAQKVFDILDDVFSRLASEGVADDELATAKNKILSSIAIKSEVPMGRLLNLGFNWIYSQQYHTVADDVRAVSRVCVEDVNKLIEDFDPGRFTCYCLGPE